MHALHTARRPGYPAPPRVCSSTLRRPRSDGEGVPGEAGGATGGGSRGRWKARLLAEARASRARHAQAPLGPPRPRKSSS